MSLRDQLLQAGIATKKQHQQARTKKKQQTKQKGQSEQNSGDTLQQAQQRQAEKDRELNKKQEVARARKALEAQIRQIITDASIPREKGDIAHRFVHQDKVKTLHLSEQQHQQLTTGQLMIAAWQADDYHLVPAAIAEKIEKRDANALIIDNKKVNKSATADSKINIEAKEDDPYADYKIPDDLMW